MHGTIRKYTADYNAEVRRQYDFYLNQNIISLLLHEAPTLFSLTYAVWISARDSHGSENVV